MMLGRMPTGHRRARWLSCRLGCAGLLALVACESLSPTASQVSSLPSLNGAVNRREQLAEAAPAKVPPAPVALPASRPHNDGGLVIPAAASQPASAPAPGQPTPLVLNRDTIIRNVYEISPLVRATREEMTAAQYALEEFRANLSRFEPYIESKGDIFEFPERRDISAKTGEVVGGVERETFSGAVMRLEGGASASDVKYGEVARGEDASDSGAGGLVRARVEVPFIGSRKRQERVISQAFQESEARKAQLDYLSDYRTHVLNALSYYLQSLLNYEYSIIYDRQARVIESLLNDSRLRPHDRLRLTSSMESSRVTCDSYRTAQRTDSLLLLYMLGLPMETYFAIEEQPLTPSPYLERLAVDNGRQLLIEEAYNNNPRFRVLEDAISDAELQRRQAIDGRYDITAFMEGTQFAFGAETFDDRVGGWQIGGGVTIRLNDSRVLTASRLKAEARIRQYQAEIEAERISIQRRIIDNADQLISYDRIAREEGEILKKKEAEFRRRSVIYFEGSDPTMSIDDVLGPMSEWTTAQIRVSANRYYMGNAELQLLSATGEFYRIAGMDMDSFIRKKQDRSGDIFGLQDLLGGGETAETSGSDAAAGSATGGAGGGGTGGASGGGAGGTAGAGGG